MSRAFVLSKNFLWPINNSFVDKNYCILLLTITYEFKQNFRRINYLRQFQTLFTAFILYLVLCFSLDFKSACQFIQYLI